MLIIAKKLSEKSKIPSKNSVMIDKNEIIKKELLKEDRYDVICPLLRPNPKYFYNNVKSWFKEIPINNLYFGCNLDSDDVNQLKDQYPEITIIDQREIKTQGKCLAELMKLVSTEWFVYLHADVELTPYCFEVMKRERAKDVGIIESNREIWDGENITYPNYVKSERSYSGFQLFQKKAIEVFIDTIEDDYIFRNEDLIFQNVIEQLGYKYIKSYAMHVHQAERLQLNNNLSIQGEKKINEYQFKGIIKYTLPTNKLIIPACLVSITNYLRKYGMDMYDFFKDFLSKCNEDWARIIINKLTGGTPNGEKSEKEFHTPNRQ